MSRLVAEPAPHLAIDSDAQDTTPPINDLEKNTLRLLEAARRPITTTDLRAKLQRRKADVVDALEALRARGTIQRDALGWTPASRG